jgi:hypothetical protein
MPDRMRHIKRPITSNPHGQKPVDVSKPKRIIIHLAPTRAGSGCWKGLGGPAG